MQERIPPQDLDAEKCVLGSMMMSKDAMALVLGKLQPDYFYRDANTQVFNAMVALYKKSEPIDLITVSAELNKMDQLDRTGGKTYLIEIVNAVPTAANIEHYANIVQEKALLRKLIDSGGQIVSEAFEDKQDVDEILSNAQKSIMEISKETVRNDLVELGSVMTTAWDNINDAYDNEDKILGISTGFADLDQLTSGFQRSDLIILAARPAMGKTALALNFAMRAALQNKDTVAIFSCEMPKEQLALRMLAAEARVNLGRLKTANIADDEYRGLAGALGRLSEAPIYIDDTPNISPLELRAKCRRLQSEVILNSLL